MILTIKTDQPNAELSLLTADGKILSTSNWLGHRQLSTTILQKINQLLEDHSCNWQDLSGLVVFRGPGSFTGLRIGITVANTLSYSLKINIAGASGDSWVADGIAQLKTGKDHKIVTPIYDRPANITKPRK